MPNLTPLSYVIVSVICLLGIVHQWSDNAFPWWRLAVSAYLLCLVYEWHRVRLAGVSVRLVSDGQLRLGRRSDLQLEFSNQSPMPLHIRCAFDTPPAIEASREEQQMVVVSHGQSMLNLTLRGLALGSSHWRSLPMRVRGTLGLGWWAKSATLDARLDVIPEKLERTERSAGLSRTGVSQHQRQGSGQELHHLREYRPGDPRHTIDWKASARSGSLITRVFGEDQHLDIVVILDCGRTSRNEIDGLSQLGHFVNMTARFAEQAVANEDRIGLIAISDRPVAVTPLARGQEAVSLVRAALTGLATVPVESDILAAAREMGRFVRHRSLVVVLTDLHGSDATSRLNQSVRLWAGHHLPMVVGLVGRELQTLTDQKAEGWLDPHVSLAARRYRRDLYRSMHGLRQIGAQTLLCRPRDLERSVLRQYLQLRANRRI